MTDTQGTDLLEPTAPSADHDGHEPLDDTPAAVPAAPPAPPEPAIQHYARAGAVICGLAAGAFHLLAMVDHMDHHAGVGRAFLGIAALQVLWASMLVRTRARAVVAAGIALNIFAIVIWVLSRSQGISWFPGLEAVEPFGWRDITTEAFQLLAIVAGALLLVSPRLFRTPDDGETHSPTPIIVMGLLALATVAWVYGATHGQVHG
ncbi:MAG TPA: hypothetical protein VFZ83_07655 [Acidimicrobiia bacterium]|nr:hypothetical protein [Acidimicrobiia bacterium]